MTVDTASLTPAFLDTAVAPLMRVTSTRDAIQSGDYVVPHK